MSRTGKSESGMSLPEWLVETLLMPRVLDLRFQNASRRGMRLIASAIAIMLLVSHEIVASAKQETAERLGYPRDSKLLIIHADDLAVAHSEDAASFDALERHAATSASIMVPCPWLTEVADYAKAHPDADSVCTSR